ncbi:MAG: hypothetical protein JNL61_11240 [Rhizobiaceae bacterium]|nr:hypothetical protein [Rhizobiaceae bacterium]
MLRFALPVLTAGFMAVPALGWSQDFDEIQRPGREIVPTIQSSISMQMPLGPGEDPMARQEAATKSFYEMAGGACAVVLQTIADECEIRSMNSDTRINDRDTRGMQMTLTGRIVMKVKFKPTAAQSAQ